MKNKELRFLWKYFLHVKLCQLKQFKISVVNQAQRVTPATACINIMNCTNYHKSTTANPFLLYIPDLFRVFWEFTVWEACVQ